MPSQDNNWSRNRIPSAPRMDKPVEVVIDSSEFEAQFGLLRDATTQFVSAVGDMHACCPKPSDLTESPPLTASVQGDHKVDHSDIKVVFTGAQAFSEEVIHPALKKHIETQIAHKFGELTDTLGMPRQTPTRPAGKDRNA